MKTDTEFTEFTVFTKTDKKVCYLAVLLCHFFKVYSGSQPQINPARFEELYSQTVSQTFTYFYNIYIFFTKHP